MSGVRRKWKRSDFFDAHSVVLMTPLTTPFDSLFSLSRKCSYDFGSESQP